MERRPELSIIAGPNGAGKSRHIVALHIAKSRIHKIEDNPPLWFKEQFEQSFNDLNHIFV
jgi:predicted ATPase